MNSQIRHFIVKYLNHSASESELDELSKWLKDPAHLKQFRSFVRIDYAIDHIMEDFNTEQEKKELLSRIRKMQQHTKVKKLWMRISGVAASVLIMVSLYFFFERETEQSAVGVNPILTNNQIETLKKKAVLVTETGEEITLEEGSFVKTHNASSNEEGLVYNKSAINKSKITFNRLTVPRGGQFFVKLSDGTEVWLNSGTELKYPVHFIKGQSRQVELVYGEAFFDVSPSSEHLGADFKVVHQQQEIQVLGTEFNIKAYPTDDDVYTTLVEGMVKINTPEDSFVLSPKQQSTLNLKTYTLSIDSVNLKEETSWVNGEYIFRQKSLKEIMSVLSRWYDIDVVFEDRGLEDAKLVGRIQKDQEITEILDRIKNFGIIQNYEINEKQIILK
ncbi:FecR family protein [Zunongwangia pacifica]|uniref:FecR family protein n=1 Tax=Zunongwangia pacifica TaxID=2911062 RepID=A0A9X1ZXN2_9FLAO|nr:FecR family protein [Zunongwangia pacifica]MCL6220453.1 FecR family protein [Zunongwangia pacifica]